MSESIKETKLSEADEQAFKLQEILDMLIAAGYFRARIKGLDSFDKIVGGMTWAILASGVPIDFDLEFKENSNIGEKIAISEKITRALTQMRCPAYIRPHQIQGVELGCLPLFPVVQWLVKAVIDHRKTTGDTVRNYTQFLFDAEFRNAPNLSQSKNDYVDFKFKDKQTNAKKELDETYALKRIFAKSNAFQHKTKSALVDGTLMEYGYTHHTTASNVFLHSSSAIGDDNDNISNHSTSKQEKNGGNQNKLANKYGGIMQKLSGTSGGNLNATKAAVITKDDEKKAQAEHEAAMEAKRLALLAKDLTQTQSKDTMSGSTLVGIIDVSHVHQGSNVYTEQSVKDDADLMNNQTANKELLFEKRKQRLNEKGLKLKTAKQECKDAYKLKLTKLNETKQEIDEFKSKFKILESKKNEFLEIENKSENQKMISKLKVLVTQNENIKNKENQFKKTCAESLKMYKEKLKKLDLLLSVSSLSTDNNNNSEMNEETLRMLKIEKLYQSTLRKSDKIRKVLASKNQELSKIERKLSDYPSRAELLQYEKRFVELYDLTNARLKETKKYYHFYNSLQNVHTSINNECTLLDQIKSEFPNRISTIDDRDDFIQSMKKITGNLENLSQTASTKLDETLKNKNTILEKYNALLSFQRNYYSCVKKFQEACQTNQQLSDKIDRYESEIQELIETYSS